MSVTDALCLSLFSLTIVVICVRAHAKAAMDVANHAGRYAEEAVTESQVVPLTVLALLIKKGIVSCDEIDRLAPKVREQILKEREQLYRDASGAK